MSLISDFADEWKKQRLDEYAQFERRQLTEWNMKTEGWELYSDDGRHMRCRECHQNVYFICDARGHSFLYNPEEIKALIIAHVRQVHSGQRESEILGDTVHDHASGIGPDHADRHLDQGSNPSGIDEASPDN